MRFLYFPRKVDVNGEDAAPIYKFLKSSKTGPFSENIKWNFAKSLLTNRGMSLSGMLQPHTHSASR